MTGDEMVTEAWAFLGRRLSGSFVAGVIVLASLGGAWSGWQNTLTISAGIGCAEVLLWCFAFGRASAVYWLAARVDPVRTGRRS